MQLKMMAFLSACLFCAVVSHAGFLQPTSFPKTIDDIPFIDRMALKIDDYETLESVYDENGRCISGCAYSALNLEDELSAMQRWDARVKQELINDYGYTADSSGNVTPPVEQPSITQSVQSDLLLVFPWPKEKYRLSQAYSQYWYNSFRTAT